MISFLLIAVFVAAAVSLLSYVYCWQDAMRGRPHIISLRQVTNIMDRARLNRLFGTPEPGYYYTLSEPALRWLKRARGPFVYGECAADIVCLVGSYRYMTDASTHHLGWFLLLAGLCQGVSFGHSIWQIRRFGHQMLEEMDEEDH